MLRLRAAAFALLLCPSIVVGQTPFRPASPSGPTKVGPPKGTVYNYPIRPWHNQQPSLTAAEAAPEIAVQIYNRAIHNQMLARIKDGQTIPQVIAWAQDELEGFAR